MGLENSAGGSRVYLKISDGRVSRRCDANEKGAIECTNKDGSKTWHEVRYDQVSGYVTNVATRETDWGKDLCVTIEDEGIAYELQMKYDSRYAKGFLMVAPNVDFSRKIVFRPWMKIVDDKKKTNLYLSHQGDSDSIEWFWTKENPKDLPQMVVVKYKGKDVWDNTDQMNYLWDFMTNNVLPKIEQAKGSVPQSYPKQSTPTVVDDSGYMTWETENDPF